MATVVYDFGHGRDTWENGGGKGVRHNGKVYEEHDANVRVGLKVIAILKEHGVSVEMSQAPHGLDSSLTSRTNDAKNSKGCKVFISNHHNAGSRGVKGACVFAWGENSPKSHALQKAIRDAYKDAGIELHGSGIHYGEIGSWTNFHINRETRFSPFATVLIENGFMTNPDEFELIFGSKKDSHSDKVAKAQAKGVLSHLGVKYHEKEADKATEKPEAGIDYNKGIGIVKIETDFLNLRSEKSLDSKVVKVLEKGQSFYAYEQDGKWFRLGGNTWVSEGSKGDLVSFKKHPKKSQPKEPKKDVYRVIVDGEQRGAYSEDSNILDQIKQAMPHLKEDIQIEKV